MDTLTGLSQFFLNLAQTAEAIVTAAGLVAAGIWTYMLFVQKRQRHPRAEVTHDVLATTLEDGRTWLHVTVTIKNIGDVLIKLACGYVRVDQVLPVPPSLQRDAAAPKRLGDEGEYPWLLVDQHECDWTKTMLREIEPAETDRFHFDFFIPDELVVATVYSHFENVHDRPKLIGWNYTTVYDRRRSSNLSAAVSQG